MHSERQPRDLMKPDLNLNTKDILGAQSWTTSFARTYSMTNNRVAFKDPNNCDISGTHSKPVIREHTKGYRPSFFDTSDIDGSAPSIVSFASKTTRSCNPLNPQYDLPSFTKVPFVQPAFLRASCDVSDIEGARPQVSSEQRFVHTFIVTLCLVTAAAAVECH